jgi:tetratricopeptide (TPR) repeat protein
MDTSKLVDDLMVTLKYPTTASPRSCFIVFSSREPHVEIIIDCVEAVFQTLGKYKIIRLDEHLSSGDSQYIELKDQLATCSFAIVVLDGLRPNVLFEYGILKGLGKPCIVLLEEKATVDIQGYSLSKTQPSRPAPLVDMDKHFSDVKDRFYVRYNKNKPKQIRTTLKKEYSKLKKQIEDAFLHVIFPFKEVVEKELSIHLRTIVDSLSSIQPTSDAITLTNVGVAHSHVERIAHEHQLSLPPDYFLALVEIYKKTHKLELAFDVINSASGSSARDVDLLLQKAHLLRDLGRMDEAIQTIDHAISLYPDRESLWHNKGIMLEKLDKKDEAIISYKKGIELNSTCSSINFHYGLILYDNKDFASALTQFQKALDKKSDDSDFKLWKARALYKLGKTLEALDIIKTVIDKDQANPDAWFVLGKFTDSYSESLGFFQRAVKLNPQHYGALCSSAANLSNLGRCDEALKIFKRMKKVCYRYESCPTIIENICITFGKMERFDEGIKFSNDILAKKPDDLIALSCKARLLARIRKYEEARDILVQLVKTKPKDSTLWYDLACVYSLLNKPSEAVQNLKKAIALDRCNKDELLGDHDFDPVRRTEVFRKAFPKVISRRRTNRIAKK